jgi:hypothetical protein
MELRINATDRAWERLLKMKEARVVPTVLGSG